MESVADRHQWAIDLGQEHAATAHQQAILVYVAFRVGPENRCYWPLDKIAEQTRMHKNTVSKCLRWWTRRGVLKATAQLRGPTIYELVLYPVERDIDTSRPVADAHAYVPDNSEPGLESNIPSDVIQYPV